MEALEPSATLAMAARAQAMAAEGIDVVDLSVGEPDFPTPEHICRAAETAIRAGVMAARSCSGRSLKSSSSLVGRSTGRPPASLMSSA